MVDFSFGNKFIVSVKILHFANLYAKSDDFRNTHAQFKYTKTSK